MISIARKRTLTGILAASFGALGVALATGAGTVAPSYEEGVKVGDKAPDFTLTDIHGEEHKLSEYTEEGKIVVLEWFNPDCPFVKKFHYKTDTMRQTYAGFEGKPVEFLAINSASAPNKHLQGSSRTEIRLHDLLQILGGAAVHAEGLCGLQHIGLRVDDGYHLWS